jgi:hypothetical protein
VACEHLTQISMSVLSHAKFVGSRKKMVDGSSQMRRRDVVVMRGEDAFDGKSPDAKCSPGVRFQEVPRGAAEGTWIGAAFGGKTHG